MLMTFLVLLPDMAGVQSLDFEVRYNATASADAVGGASDWGSGSGGDETGAIEEEAGGLAGEELNGI